MIILLMSEDLEEPRGRAHISMDTGLAGGGDGDGDEGVDVLARRKRGSIEHWRNASPFYRNQERLTGLIW